jgi:hypothetical protein
MGNAQIARRSVLKGCHTGPENESTGSQNFTGGLCHLVQYGLVHTLEVE